MLGGNQILFPVFFMRDAVANSVTNATATRTNATAADATAAGRILESRYHCTTNKNIWSETGIHITQARDDVLRLFPVCPLKEYITTRLLQEHIFDRVKAKGCVVQYVIFSDHLIGP